MKKTQPTQQTPIQFPYAAKLQKAMANFASACVAIEAIALEHQLHSAHVADLTKFTRDRLGDMHKKISHRPAEFSLTTVFDDDSTSGDVPAGARDEAVAARADNA